MSELVAWIAGIGGIALIFLVALVLGAEYRPVKRLRYRMGRSTEAIIRWVAWKLPRRLVMWCGFRIGAHATTGKYGNQIVPDLKFMDAMDRWDKPA